MKLLRTRHLAILTTLSALCIAIQLTPRPPNVEFTSLIIFFVGTFFGIILGSGLGAIVMLVNGFLSPYGFAGIMLPFQILGMVIVGVVGGLYGQGKKGVYELSSCFEAAVLGAFLTLVYDILTNFGVAFSLMLSEIPFLTAFFMAIVSGAPFLLIHVVSNFFIFMIAFLPITKTLQEVFGGENTWRKEASPI